MDESETSSQGDLSTMPVPINHKKPESRRGAGRRRRILGIVIVAVVVLVFLLPIIRTRYYHYLAASRFDIPIPDYAGDVRLHYYGLLQGHSMYVRFNMPLDRLDEYLGRLCPNGYDEVEDHSGPFPTDSHNPDWWTPNNAQVHLAGICGWRAFLVDAGDTTRYTLYVLGGL